MEKKDSAPPSPSRSPAGGSPTAHSAGQLASPSSPNTRCPVFPPGRELFSPYPYSTRSRAASSRQGPGDDDSPRNPDRPVMLRSLEDVYASTDPIEESSDAKVPRRLGFQSPREAKSSGADFHSPGPPLTGVSSLGSQEKESSAPSQHYQEIKDTVLADHLMQEMVTVEDQTSLGTGSGGPVGSQPRPSGPSPPKGPMGPDPGPQAPGSPEKPENVQALQSHEGQGGSDDPVPMGPDPGPQAPGSPSEKPVILLAHEGRGGSDDPVGLGGPVGSPSGPGEPSQDMTTETSGDHSGSGPGSELSDEPNV